MQNTAYIKPQSSSRLDDIGLMRTANLVDCYVMIIPARDVQQA